MAYGNQKPRGGKEYEKRDFVFHSVLVTASPVRLTVDKEPRFFKQKDVDLVDITITDSEGGSNKVTYWCENQACSDFFKGKMGQTFTIIAKGGGKSPEQKATASIDYAGGQKPVTQQSQSAAPAANGGGTGTHRNAQTPEEIKKGVLIAKGDVARGISLIKITLRGMASAAKEMAADKELPITLSTEQIQKFAIFLCIGADRAGHTARMPFNLGYHDLKPIISERSGKKQTETKKEPPRCVECGNEVTKEGETCPDCIALKAETPVEEDVPF